ILGYQIILLSVAFALGQLPFFWRYEKKLLQRLRIMKSNQAQNLNAEIQNPQSQTPNPQFRIAIFASGAGSNAHKIIQHFKDHPVIEVALIVCNKPGAGVLAIAQKEGISTLLIERETFFRGDGYVPALQAARIQFIVLAGFLWKIPQALITAFPKRIINIHPALLPKYGGKGMYGGFVHAAVLTAGEKESGITIHYVDEHYDNGDIIFQATCPVQANDTPETLASRIHQLEHQHFPLVVEKVIGSIQ
ncbi:MAG TPA: phosphoribosylglycinamide formyltransferase, partial [Flavisolibacter sp.]|nr:phosphoribosylglycinamide formyltransferase [Flavisolibacter sp.]